MGPQLATVSLVLLTLFVNSHPTTVPLVAYTSEDVGEGYDEGSGEIAEFFELEPTTERPETMDFDCNGLENGNYADGCSDVFYVCSNNVAFRRYCPQGTVYNPIQKTCDYDCTEARTTATPAYSEPTTTRSRPEYTTTPQDDVASTTTAVYETTPGFDGIVTAATTTTTTHDPIVCQEGQVTTFGMCSSRFNRCQSNTVRSKQCPVNTLFESSLLLCVFDLPQCQPVTIPATPVYNFNGPPSDTIVSPFDENALLKPKFDRKRNYDNGPAPVRRSEYGNGNSYIENPFFIPRHYPRHHKGVRRHHSGPEIDSPFSTAFRGRAALNDQFKDYRRASMGRINYGDARKVEGNKRFLIDDKFDGPNARYVQSSIQQVFPEHRHSKRRLGPREDPDGYNDDKTFDAKDLFGATRRKRSAYYGSQPSGYTQISARQAQVNKDCQQYTTPTFLTFGNCFDQFIYCSGNGVNRMAACPIGETFNKALRVCSETCGVPTSVVTATTGVQTSDDSTWSSINTGNDNSADQVTDEQVYTTQAPSEDLSSNVQPDTTTAPAGGRCSSVPSGLFSLGCSQKYIQCSNGAAVVRSCIGSLYFHQDEQLCVFRDQVPECGAQDTTTWSPVVTASESEVTSSYGEYTTPAEDSGFIQPLPYATLEDILSTTQATTTIGNDETTVSYVTAPSVDYTTSSSYGENTYASKGTSSYGEYTTLSEDKSWNEQPTTTIAPAGGRCSSVPSGLYSLGCSQKYIQCSNGAAVVRSCIGSLYFHQDEQLCAFRDQVPECGAQDTTDSYIAVTSDDYTTTSSYGEESPTSEDTSSYGEYTTPAEDSGLIQPLPYVTLEDVLSTTQATTTIGNDETTVSYVTIPSYGYTTTSSYGEKTHASKDTTAVAVTDPYNRADDSEEKEEEIGYNQKCTVGSRASTGFCVQSYLECTANVFVEKSCRVGKLFDTHANRCVPRIACGKEAIREAIKDVIATAATPTKKIDGRCAHVDGEGIFALGSCSSNYVRCSYGAAKLQYCSGNQVFSNAKAECVNRESASECNVAHSPPVKSYYNNNDQSAYCDGKADGLYGNKRDCSAILQCFGGELFEHTSCQSNLAFNELTGKCDYPQKVSGCENHGRKDGVCTEHGSFVSDVEDCSLFYRCVWGRKVVIRCPSGTVFNPALSVCDWPSAVPSCGRSSYNDDNLGY